MDIKDIWEQDKSEATPEISLEQRQKIHFPLEIIRKNMKMEFWFTVLTYPPLILALFYWIKDTKALFFSLLLVAMMLLITYYYFRKFSHLYQRISIKNLDTYHHLSELKYELKINAELYKSYYVAAIPIIFCELVLIFEHLPVKALLMSPISMLMFIMILLFSLLFLYFYGKVWFEGFYGKHIKQITNLVNLLVRREDELSQYETSTLPKLNFPFVDKTQKWLAGKYGENKARLYNTILWLILGFLILLIASFVLGFLIGYLQLAGKLMPKI